ncbi:MAG TPA: DUF4280 domain-containing protein [Arcobacter sp.]|nr:DUF4280 domain-containing protein [Arcobacter sp.]
MGMSVCNGAMLTCSFGVAPSSMIVLPKNKVLMETQPAANIMDNIPLTNIMPFGMCQAPSNPAVIAATSAAMGVFTPVPCVPNTVTPWTPAKPSVLLGTMPVINNSSVLNCMWLGVITVSNPGEKSNIV